MLRKREIEEKEEDTSKNKERKSSNEYTPVCTVAVTTRQLIASSHKTAYQMNNTDTHTAESREPRIFPQAIASYIGFSGDQSYQNTAHFVENKNGTRPYAFLFLPNSTPTQ